MHEQVEACSLFSVISGQIPSIGEIVTARCIGENSLSRHGATFTSGLTGGRADLALVQGCLTLVRTRVALIGDPLALAEIGVTDGARWI